MSRLHAATAIVAASLGYLALSLADRETAISGVLAYIAIVVTLLFCTTWHKERKRGPTR